MTSRNAPKQRTPNEIANKWQKKQVARIGDAAIARFSLELQTADTTFGYTRLLIDPTDRVRSTVPTVGRTSGYVWSLDLKSSSARLRNALTTPLVQVMGIPAPDTPGYGTPENPNKPYDDRLFKGGDLLLQPFLIEQRPGEVAPLRLGAVTGLSLIVARNTIRVW